MKSTILTASTSLLALAIAASFFFLKAWLPSVFLLCNVLAAILCIFLFDRDDDVGCLVGITCNSLLFVGWYCGLSFHQMTDISGTRAERVGGGVGFFAILCALAAFAYFEFFR